ncbi:MAG TPA: hypothetical protein VHS27_21565 [Gaiellales bacterium]|jgi:hypothetical protein|nr:hypothetical protein [Gaiellales bacterium]
MFATAGVLVLLDLFVIHESKAKIERIGKHMKIHAYPTHWNDYVHTGIWVVAVILIGYGIVRRNALSEDPADEADAAPRMFGDSIVDARTQVDPAIGLRPVNTTRDR